MTNHIILSKFGWFRLSTVMESYLWQNSYLALALDAISVEFESPPCSHLVPVLLFHIGFRVYFRTANVMPFGDKAKVAWLLRAVTMKWQAMIMQHSGNLGSGKLV